MTTVELIREMVANHLEEEEKHGGFSSSGEDEKLFMKSYAFEYLCDTVDSLKERVRELENRLEVDDEIARFKRDS